VIQQGGVQGAALPGGISEAHGLTGADVVAAARAVHDGCAVVVVDAAQGVGGGGEEPEAFDPLSGGGAHRDLRGDLDSSPDHWPSESRS
jgi:hypothetical protein